MADSVKDSFYGLCENLTSLSGGFSHMETLRESCKDALAEQDKIKDGKTPIKIDLQLGQIPALDTLLAQTAETGGAINLALNFAPKKDKPNGLWTFRPALDRSSVKRYLSRIPSSTNDTKLGIDFIAPQDSVGFNKFFFHNDAAQTSTDFLRFLEALYFANRDGLVQAEDSALTSAPSGNLVGVSQSVNNCNIKGRIKDYQGLSVAKKIDYLYSILQTFFSAKGYNVEAVDVMPQINAVNEKVQARVATCLNEVTQKEGELTQRNVLGLTHNEVKYLLRLIDCIDEVTLEKLIALPIIINPSENIKPIIANVSALISSIQDDDKTVVATAFGQLLGELKTLKLLLDKNAKQKARIS